MVVYMEGPSPAQFSSSRNRVKEEYIHAESGPGQVVQVQE